MTKRRAIPGVRTRPPLRDDAEYRGALAELHLLGQAALGTKATRGLQDLVDCILDYESAQASVRPRMATFSDHAAGSARHNVPDNPGGPE